MSETDLTIDLSDPSSYDPSAEGIFFAKVAEEDVRKMRLINDRTEQDNAHRISYSQRAFGLVQMWLGFMIVIISAQFGLSGFDLGLQTEEFIAVIVSSTGLVFGFWMLVGRYLFPNGSKNE